MFVLSTIDRLLITFKWKILLRSRGLMLEFVQGMRMYCTSMIWGSFLPSTVGADALRASMAMRAGLPGTEVVASIVVERITGTLCNLLAALLGLLAISAIVDVGDGPWASLWFVGGLMLASAIGAVALSLSRSLFDRIITLVPERFRDSRPLRKLRQVHAIYVEYYSNGRSIAAASALSFSEIAVNIVMNWACALALHVDVSLAFFAGAFLIARLVARLPISIDGFGVFEGIFAAFLLMAGVREEAAVSIALLGRIVQTASWIPWWIAYALDTRELRPAADLSAPQ